MNTLGLLRPGQILNRTVSKGLSGSEGITEDQFLLCGYGLPFGD
jgi:hypothetical protein